MVIIFVHQIRPLSGTLQFMTRRTNERVERFALDSNHRHAKYSARLLAMSKNKDDLGLDIINVCFCLVSLVIRSLIF